MITHFEERTKKHIELVKKWYQKLVVEYYSISLIDIDLHDSIKFQEPEYTPYVYLTWNYYCKDHNIFFEVSPELQEKMNKATIHHITHQAHHPEYWDSNFNSSMFNQEDRDKPAVNIVNSTSMPLKYVLEMLADWFSMSEEKGTDPWEWANKNVNIRWRFTPEQINLIESALTFYDEKTK